MQGDRVLIDRIAVAHRVGERTRGLMFRTEIPEHLGAGYFFPRCRSLHTCSMRFKLDILFVDAEGQVVEVHRKVKPYRMIFGPTTAAHCLEVVGGSFPEVGEEPFIWLEVSSSQPSNREPF